MQQDDQPQVRAAYTRLVAEAGNFLEDGATEDLLARVADVQRAVATLRASPLTYEDAPAWARPLPEAHPVAVEAPKAPVAPLPGPQPGDRLEQLFFAPVWQLADWIRSGRTSPDELTEMTLDRLARHGPALNALAHLLPERARAEAAAAACDLRQGRDRGPLHGIPFGAKDLLATAGSPTTWGAAPLRHQQFPYDAAVLRRLSQAGSVLAAKLAMVELAGGAGYDRPEAAWTGPGVNPWRTDRWSGGSSSGTGSAVAAGLVPWGIGTETWESILTPSAFCGLSGLRPSLGRVDGRGAMVLSWTLDKIGPMCRDAFDCGLVLEGMTAPLPGAQGEHSWRFTPQPDRPFHFALVRDTTLGLHPDVASCFERALETAGTLGTITEIELPSHPILETTQVILWGEMGGAFDDFLRSTRPQELTAPEDHYRAYANLTVTASDYLRALRLRGKIMSSTVLSLADFDAVIYPAVAGEPALLDQRFSEQPWRSDARISRTVAALGCLAGLPAITVPMGFTSCGCPAGLAFLGSFGAENAILDAAIAYQRCTDWHRQHPSWA
ncbi:MAG: amidase [Chloroflexi bacterium]|nr:amidase [Chloroflexota bacterium]